MLLKTLCYGEIDINERRCLTFSRGILGFSHHRDYLLMPCEQNAHTYWLQSVQQSDFAFMVTDPERIVPGYARSIRSELVRGLGIRSLSQVQLLVIVDQHGERSTANMRGPLVVNIKDRLGEQYVLPSARYSTRMPLSELPSKQRETGS
jgi:flagellar assembly factor FliW